MRAQVPPRIWWASAAAQGWTVPWLLTFDCGCARYNALEPTYDPTTNRTTGGCQEHGPDRAVVAAERVDLDELYRGGAL